MTTKQFVNKHGITATSEYTDYNKLMGDTPMNHYKVTLHRQTADGRPKRMTLTFSKGMGLQGEPTATEVLECLVMDARGLEYTPDFEDWAGDYGYDTDSRQAEKVYKAVNWQTLKLKRFLGGYFDEALKTEEE